MNYKIISIPPFEKQLRKLAKKYPSLGKELLKLKEILLAEPATGTSLGKGIYKIRLAVSSKGKGKSGGMRVITYVKIVAQTIYLIAIYDKSEIENISEKVIREKLADIP